MCAQGVVQSRQRSLLRLRPEAGSAKAARAAIDGLFADTDYNEARFHARLLATELVTNSVLHSGLGPEDRLELRVELLPDRVRVDVIDGGRWLDRGERGTDRRRSQSGRGLILVGALADRWGIVKNGTTRVWFEIDLERPRI